MKVHANQLRDAKEWRVIHGVTGEEIKGVVSACDVTNEYQYTDEVKRKLYRANGKQIIISTGLKLVMLHCKPPVDETETEKELEVEQ